MQHEYNVKHGIVPRTVNRIDQLITDRLDLHDYVDLTADLEKDLGAGEMTIQDIRAKITSLETDMRHEAKALNFEKAADIRDQLLKYKELELKWGK
jgi:excinuclease ABC subunit B